MTAPMLFRRDSADVQAMRLEDRVAMWVASDWLRDHGVRSSKWLPKDSEGPTLTIYGPGSRMVARLGDWLTYDGEVFAVEADDGGKPSGHTKVEGAA